MQSHTKEVELLLMLPYHSDHVIRKKKNRNVTWKKKTTIGASIHFWFISTKHLWRFACCSIAVQWDLTLAAPAILTGSAMTELVLFLQKQINWHTQKENPTCSNHENPELSPSVNLQFALLRNSRIVHFPLLVRPLFGFISRRLYKIKSDLLLTVTGQKQDCIFVSVNEHNFCKIQSNKIEA